ncbi:protein phosphatase 2C domain-containing protein [Vibrio parahaemolyticus]|uniref:PP2C family protein-serine/threonine phosphatase n=1 Tax=Vibrio harveyi group TaxID=717610 RepID=UPI000BAF1526|nr:MULTISPECIES: protein phosphatase 2C domain-containing protein [Vibrio harveyi group]EJG1724420.1 protein phosphatase 2C domain-containing protein [Vibrio parahaemolyticus]EJG1740133.1 protein phosphatase 2C domain-containing protein [Vibrio parahaemolyticus]EJG1751859.1 protein phosphatase 2C domain-containing protein [Vibrio parahaemolyticus]EJG1755508.1 protein phosphatase 2C domain-containing protein [Vibrio parahaemolyticus]MCR9908959.1 protein phosphatase 2C domain-containing protein 
MIKVVESVGFSFAKSVEGTNADAILSPITVNGELLLAIADGVGSYKGSDLASLTAIEHLQKSCSPSDLCLGSSVFNDILTKVKALSEYNIEYEKASTTLTYLFTSGKNLHIGHIGDCRAYIQINRKLHQLTKDHTKHQQFLDHKLFTKKELKNVKGKNVITTAISQVVDMQPESFKVSLEDYADQQGMVTLFLMSDGVHEFWEKNPRFSPNTMSSVVKFANSMQRRVERSGPKDDYSLVAVRFKV